MTLKITYKATQTDIDANEIDALIYAVGYEDRSAYAVTRLEIGPERGFGIVYSNNRIFGFERNLKDARARGHSLCADDATDFSEALDVFLTLQLRGKPVRLGVDVSAMNRNVMAEVILSVTERLRENDVLSLLYTPARFQPPDIELIPLRAVGLAHARLSGSIADPSKGRCMLMGLGYEYGLSLSVLDRHEPDMSFLFRPLGFDPRFYESIRVSNFDFDFGERDYEIVDYRLDDIAHLYDTLNSILVSSKSRFAISCVPFGPKIFSAVAIVCASLHFPDVTVLRYSLSDALQPINAVSDDRLVGLDLKRGLIGW